MMDSFWVGLDGFRVVGHDGKRVGSLDGPIDGNIVVRITSGFEVTIFEGPKEKGFVKIVGGFDDFIVGKFDFKGGPVN